MQAVTPENMDEKTESDQSKPWFNNYWFWGIDYLSLPEYIWYISPWTIVT
jgi:hypothetical protein